MNLPQLTAQLGAAESKVKDVLHSIVKPLSVKPKKDETFHAVYLTFDLPNNCIRFEDSIKIEESGEELLNYYLYLGNNSAASSQIYVVRETRSLVYLLTSVWNDLALSLQNYQLTSTRLYQLLTRMQEQGLVSIGKKKGQGKLCLDKLELPPHLADRSVAYDKTKRNIVIGDREVSFENFLNIVLDNQNRKHKYVLVIPRVKDENDVYVLSQMEEYKQLVKLVNNLGELLAQPATKKASKQQERICYICHEEKPDVSSSNTKQLSRTGINKIFTTTTINSARYTSRGADYDDAYSICVSCYNNLRVGENFISNNLRTKIAGENAFLLPEPLFGEFDYNKIGKIKEDLDFAFQSQEANAWLDRVEAESDWLDIANYMIHIIVYRTDGNSVTILETMEDVPTLRIKQIMNLFHRHAESVKPHLAGMSLGNIYRIIPVTESKNGQVDIGRVLSFYKSILSGELIRTETVFGYACEALDKGMAQLRKSSISNYNNMSLHSYSNNKEDFFIKAIVMQYLVLLHTLQDLQLLNLPFNDQREGVLMGADEQKTQPDALGKMEEFLNVHQFKPEAKALFYLGAMIQRVAREQYKNEHKTKPILQKINFQGMNQREVNQLYLDACEKFRQYKIFDYYCELLIKQFNKHYGAIRENWPLSDHENVFYIMSGYGYSVGGKADSLQSDQSVQNPDENG